jgi:dihydroxyacetone kinase
LRAGDPNAAATWVGAFSDGCRAVAALGGAARGERTMLDALLPAWDSLTTGLTAGRSPRELLHDAATAAEAGAAATASMRPRRGRSSYLGERVLGHPDPGAVAVAVGLRALADDWDRMPT